MTIAPVILVVDDDPSIRESLERELRASGYTTASGSDGLGGVQAFDSHAPDLVLTDLSMPRSDGFELISSIRAKSRTPIIVLSVRGNDADKIRALDLGADDFVTKPFSVGELLARVRAQLRRTGGAATTTLAFAALSIARVWRDAPGTTADTVRVHMSALRKKIEPDPSSPRYIVTEPWVGYRFIAEPV
jgi:two-component system KDP operon response regulator KdpE